MDWLKENVAWLGLLVGMVGAMFKYLFAHNKKHQLIDDRLAGIEDQLKEGGSLFEENKSDHEELKTQSSRMRESMARVETDLKWLVNTKRRENGGRQNERS